MEDKWSNIFWEGSDVIDSGCNLKLNGLYLTMREHEAK